jgi:hypothetical protein
MGVRDEIKREIETKRLRERENREDENEKESESIDGGREGRFFEQ